MLSHTDAVVDSHLQALVGKFVGQGWTKRSQHILPTDVQRRSVQCQWLLRVLVVAVKGEAVRHASTGTWLGRPRSGGLIWRVWVSTVSREVHTN